MIQTEVIKAFIKAGSLGIVLAWALWENSKLTERVFTVVDNNTRVLLRFETSCSDKLSSKGF